MSALPLPDLFFLIPSLGGSEPETCMFWSWEKRTDKVDKRVCKRERRQGLRPFSDRVRTISDIQEAAALYGLRRIRWWASGRWTLWIDCRALLCPFLTQLRVELHLYFKVMDSVEQRSPSPDPWTGTGPHRKAEKWYFIDYQSLRDLLFWKKCLSRLHDTVHQKCSPQASENEQKTSALCF